MTVGRLIAVVGASGVGKDSVMAGLHRALPDMHLVRRVITRAPDPDGEDHEAVTKSQFDAMAARGDFALHWRAHGLSYGIPVSVKGHLDAGTDCIANVSRGALEDAARSFARLVVLNITAKPHALAQRLAERGRETEREIAGRLSQSEKPLPGGLDVIQLANDGPLERTIARAATLLQPARA